LLPHSGAVGPFHDRRLGPLVDGSNRVDNLPDSGGKNVFPFGGLRGETLKNLIFTYLGG
jgi:hypothetical protein